MPTKKITLSELRSIVKEIIKEERTEKFINIKQLLNIAANAGDIVLDAKTDLISLAVAYDKKIPLNSVVQVLNKYDIELKEVSHKNKGGETTKWLSIEDLDNMGLI